MTENDPEENNGMSNMYIIAVVIGVLILLYLIYISINNILYGGQDSFTSAFFNFGEAEYNLASAFDIAK